MPIDPYASCTCGSGKKFKWCCGPIHEQMERAFRLDADGQHDAALKAMDEVVAAHSDNPEVYGRKALLLFQHGRDQDAEAALERAFQLNPNYPYGYFLRGRVRQAEGEILGALLLFRKAAEVYDPRSHDILTALYAAIAECEMQLNRPVAGRAALDMALAQDTSNTELRKAVETAFGEDSALPRVARLPYSLKGPAATAAPERKRAWQNALATHTTGRLSDARQAFEQLVAADAEDAAAWYNLALVRAWLGDNVAALEALAEYVNREPDETKAAAAWALGEVLRCGAGVPQTDSDYVEHAVLYEVRQGQKVQKLLEYLEQHARLLGGRLDQQSQVFTAIVTEAPKLLAAGSGTPQVARFGAHLAIVQHLLRLSGPNRQQLLTLAAELEKESGDGLHKIRDESSALPLRYVLIEAIIFPLGQISDEEYQKQFTEGMARYLEDTWIHRPLHSLSNIAPVDAAGHATLRKKLLGVIRFLEECAEAQKHPYDFNRLRRKLGLQSAGTSAPAPATAGAAAPAPDIAAMSAAELAGLSASTLNDEQLEQAYQAARKLDARELAASFLERLVERPPQAGKPDRFPWFGQLIQNAVDQNDTERALQFVDAGEKADCEQNEGRRRNDYELWRARLHARRGDVAQAGDIFDRLLARVPDNLRYRSTAAEAMLSAKDAGRALRFAEDGLGAARKQKDRDSEEHFMELAEAARKRGG